MILTGIVSYSCFQDRVLFSRLEFNAYLTYHRKQFYRLLSYGFVHADWPHLLINMLVLHSFGIAVIYQATFLFKYPVLFFFGLYFGGLIMSTMYAFFRHRNNYHYNAVGASGAVSAVVFASILFYPVGSIRLFLIPFDIPAYIFGFLYLLYSAIMAKRAQDNVGHDAHFFGALFGLLFPLVIDPRIINVFVSFFQTRLF